VLGRMRKRKYCNISEKSQKASAGHEHPLFQYQDMSAEQCLDKLMTVLDRKPICQKFNRQMHPSIAVPTTHNMVTTIHIETNTDRIDLEMISSCIANSCYDKKRFAAITIRIDAPKTTALLFSSGKLVITGASSKQIAVAAVRSTIYMLKNVFSYLDVSFKNHIIQNIVCNVRISDLETIDIQSLHSQYGTSCTYQPCIFPGLIFRPDNSPIVLLIFKSARIVVTGARQYDDIVCGFNDIIATLRPFFVYTDKEQLEDNTNARVGAHYGTLPVAAANGVASLPSSANIALI